LKASQTRDLGHAVDENAKPVTRDAPALRNISSTGQRETEQEERGEASRPQNERDSTCGVRTDRGIDREEREGNDRHAERVEMTRRRERRERREWERGRRNFGRSMRKTHLNRTELTMSSERTDERVKDAHSKLGPRATSKKVYWEEQVRGLHFRLSRTPTTFMHNWNTKKHAREGTDKQVRAVGSETNILDHNLVLQLSS
jgi:hypothetical protein